LPDNEIKDLTAGKYAFTIKTADKR